MFNLQKETIFELDSLIDELAKRNLQKRVFGKSLRQYRNKLSSLPDHLKNRILDEYILTELSPCNLAGLTVGGVDGGYASRTLLGVDLFVFRSIAVYSTFDHSGIYKTGYFPSKTPPIDLSLTGSGPSLKDAETIGSLNRAMSEIQVAYNVIKNSPKKIDIIILDGSPIIKSPISENSDIFSLYISYHNILFRLLDLAKETNIILSWVVKDSRLNIYTKFLGKILPFLLKGNETNFFTEKIDYRGIIRNTRDMDLLFHVLLPNQRSFAYIRDNRYFNDKIKDSFDLFTFFLKTVPYDVPLRIELFNYAETNRDQTINLINKVSSVVLALSQYDNSYSVPSMIVEADARVKIKQAEVDVLVDYLQKKIYGTEFMELRRSKSPWKF